MLNAAASHTSFDAPVIKLVDPSRDRTTRLTQNTLIGTAGVRQVVIDGLVALSGFGGLRAGNTWVNGEALLPVELSAGPQAGSSAVLVGAVIGVAVERELVESLSVRLGVEALSLTWLRTTTTQPTADGPKETELNETSLGLALDPSLELRLYF